MIRCLGLSGLILCFVGVDAEGFQLDLGLLPYILELTCHTWVVQRNTLELVCITRSVAHSRKHSHPPSPAWLDDTSCPWHRPSGPPRSLEISLLLVPGHYSFLVPRQPGEPEEEDEQQQYEQQSPYFGIPSPISPGTWHQARDDSCLTVSRRLYHQVVSLPHDDRYRGPESCNVMSALHAAAAAELTHPRGHVRARGEERASSGEWQGRARESGGGGGEGGQQL